jgi:hypothetical protein
MAIIEYENRNCDICDSANLTSIWRYDHKSKTRNQLFEWHVNNVVCQKCGFAFASPAPTKASLVDYYGDAFSITATKTPDYSIAKRVKVIREFSPPNKTRFVEIGSNNCPAFLSEIHPFFTHIETVEINNECNSTHRSIKTISPASVDVLAAYFVLEHVPNPGEFLRDCSVCLTDNGALIIEVPNLYIYPKDPAGLFLHEHVNHFSPRSLIALAQRNGLDVLDCRQNDCSRPYGFVAIFRRKKSKISTEIMSDPIGVTLAASCIREGKGVIDVFFNQVQKTRTALLQVEGHVVIWGANEICSHLLRDFDLPANTTIVDSDPRKANYLSQYPTLRRMRTTTRRSAYRYKHQTACDCHQEMDTGKYHSGAAFTDFRSIGLLTPKNQTLTADTRNMTGTRGYESSF